MSNGTVFYNDCGLWNDPDLGQGLEVLEGGVFGYYAEMSHLGSGSQRIEIRWEQDGQIHEAISDAALELCGWDVQSQGDGTLVAQHGDLEIRKVEVVPTSGWEDLADLNWGRSWSVAFELHNTGTTPMTGVQILHTTDAEQDVHLGGDSSTDNDVFDTRLYGYDNWAVALPQTSHVALGYYACSSFGEVGFMPEGGLFADELVDPDGASGDLDLAWRSAPVDLAPDAYHHEVFSAFVGSDDDGRLVPSTLLNEEGDSLLDVAAMLAADASCVVLDRDGDGLVEASMGGSDCDDDDDEVGSALYGWWPDADGDGFGSIFGLYYNCHDEAPIGHVAFDGSYDCDDFDFFVMGGQDELCNGFDDDCDGEIDEEVAVVFYRDLDGDGFGDIHETSNECPAPDGFVAIAGDCDDTLFEVNPDRADDPSNELDEDCDGLFAAWIDTDGDGFGGALETQCTEADCAGEGASHAGDDCDDTSAVIRPGGFDIPGNPLDEDCDGDYAAYLDADGDGLAGGLAEFIDCLSPTCANDPNGSMVPGDCDDTSAAVFPGADDIPSNGIDEDCDGDFASYVDGDGDGFGQGPFDCATPDCAGIGAVVSAAGDCDDLDPQRFPGAREVVGNEIDEDCDGNLTMYVDADGDGYGGRDVTSCLSLPCDGAAALDDDCDDSDAEVSPGAVDVPASGVDNNCDERWTCFRDLDGDGFGSDPSAVILSLSPECDGPGESSVTTDCDEGDRAIHPGASDVPGNDVDEDCDGRWAVYVDADGDGHGSIDVEIVQSSVSTCDEPGTSCSADDCDDGDAAISPSATEVPDNDVDEDCNGGVACYLDGDRDGFGIATLVNSLDDDCDDIGEASVATDCDDGDRSVNPAADEVPGNDIDENCDEGFVCWSDADADGYGSDQFVVSSDANCTDPGEAELSGDCNDADSAVNPAAPEVPGNDVDENCDSVTTCWVDGDGDGFGGGRTVPDEDGDCFGPGESEFTGDCDDANADLSPAGVEIVGSEIDSDCDGRVLCWVDDDRDGFGNDDGDFVSVAGRRCRGPRVSADANDCDDSRADVFPGGNDRPGNLLDEDCDGALSCFVDADADGYGDRALPAVRSQDGQCQTPGESMIAGDCDDSDEGFNPGASDVPAEGLDRNCDGQWTCWSDADNDGIAGTDGGVVSSLDPRCRLNYMSLETGDCDDLDPGVYPGAPEEPGSGVDVNCDDQWTCFGDWDGDGYGGDGVISPNQSCSDPGESQIGGDCDDTKAHVSPEGTEVVANNIDEDCDGTWACYSDGDGDGFGAPDSLAYNTLPRCVGFGLSWTDNDCDDANVYAYPGALEVLGNEVDEDCDGKDGGGVTRIETPIRTPTSCSSSPGPSGWWALTLLLMARRRETSGDRV